MTLTKYLTGNKFGLWVDLRSMADTTMHGNGQRLVNTQLQAQLVNTQLQARAPQTATSSPSRTRRWTSLAGSWNRLSTRHTSATHTRNTHTNTHTRNTRNTHTIYHTPHGWQAAQDQLLSETPTPNKLKGKIFWWNTKNTCQSARSTNTRATQTHSYRWTPENYHSTH